MKKLLSASIDWLYTSWIASIIDRFFVATYNVSYKELVVYDDHTGNALVVCGVCTVLRTMVVTALFTSFLWWVL